ncbi:hypothetical protein EBR57_09105 [bacterium]|nr:hypothetical protein [bacterium]
MICLRFINPYSAARAVAAVSLGLTIIVEIPTALYQVVGIFRFDKGISVLGHILMSSLAPVVIVPLFVFVTVVIVCRLYNRYAEKFGGIEVDLW